jgi:catechol 2,3-dioxygenase-like lactoylglutathione lyase family enzyme
MYLFDSATGILDTRYSADALRNYSEIAKRDQESGGGPMTHSFYGIDHVQLAAPPGCEEEARRFFGQILGMEEIPKPEALRKRGGVWFRCGAQQIHIGVEENLVPAKKAHPAFHVKDLQALKAQLAKHGIPVRDDELLPGADRFYVEDPFGNRLEFLEWKE